MDITMEIQRIVFYFMPLFVAGTIALQTLIIFASSSVTGVGAKFRQLFNLAAGCSLISMLGSIASVIVLKAKGATTIAELRPPMGIDIFLPEGTNKFLMAFFSYFSLFQVWWIIMAVLIFSIAFRVSKGKAIVAILPVVVLFLLFRLGGAAFRA